jgi:hypothetical protein
VILLRLLAIGAAYGLGFMLIKSLFPTPIVLLMLQGGGSSEGNLTVLALVYMGIGLLAGLIAAPLFGGFLLLRRGSGHAASSGSRLTLSLALALLTLGAYAVGILPTGGVLDPLRLIRSSIFPIGPPLIVAWTIARDLLPAGLTGLFLSPVSGSMLQRLYAAERPPEQKHYEWEE